MNRAHAALAFSLLVTASAAAPAAGSSGSAAAPRSGRAGAKPAASAHASALPFVADDYTRALAEARARKVPLFVEAWAPW